MFRRNNRVRLLHTKKAPEGAILVETRTLPRKTIKYRFSRGKNPRCFEETIGLDSPILKKHPKVLYWWRRGECLAAPRVRRLLRRLICPANSLTISPTASAFARLAPNPKLVFSTILIIPIYRTRQACSVYWWRRGESNPCPKRISTNVYECRY